MENVEVKKEEVVTPTKKVVKKAAKKDAKKVSFMEDRNAKRVAAKLEPAYSKEEIAAYK
jgi:hypothetical protein